MMHRRNFTRAAAGGVVSVWLPRAWAQKAGGPGVTDTEILLGNISPQSGPLSSSGVVPRAVDAYFKKVNDEGGINGRKIRYLMLDDGYNPARTVELARRLVEQEQVLATVFTVGTPPNTAIQRYMNQRKVPQVFVGSGTAKFGDAANFPWTMGWQPTGYSEARIFVQHVLETRPAARIAVLYQNDDFGKDYVRGFRDALGERAKSMIVAEASYEATDPTVDNQMVALKASGADVFFNVTVPKFAVQAIKKTADLGWKPVHYLCNSSNNVGSVMLPAGPENSKGIISASHMKDPSDPNWQTGKEWDDFVAWQKKYFPEGNSRDNYVVIGYVVGIACTRVLTSLKDNITRESFMDRMANMDMELPMMLPGVRIKTAPNDYFPIKQMQLLRFTGATWERFGKLYG